ncbi:hypothetical protein ON010_g13701 [Phytophthora cinnamomi]|nr:hypothetical protein ON010_g13701 [Phytophthora cinnamomi]
MNGMMVRARFPPLVLPPCSPVSQLTVRFLPPDRAAAADHPAEGRHGHEPGQGPAHQQHQRVPGRDGGRAHHAGPARHGQADPHGRQDHHLQRRRHHHEPAGRGAPGGQDTRGHLALAGRRGGRRHHVRRAAGRRVHAPGQALRRGEHAPADDHQELPQGRPAGRAEDQGHRDPRGRLGRGGPPPDAGARQRHGAQLEAHLTPQAIVDAVLSLDEGLDISMVGVKKVPGGSVTDSFLVKGVAFKKTFSYAGFEQQPKTFVNPKILLLNVELELKSEKENAEVRLDDPTKYQSIVDAEWNIIYEKLELCVKSGAQIILSKLPVGDLATQYFADRGLFCAGRVAQDDMERTQRATGGVVQTSVHDMNPSVLGSCGRFEERQVGNERYNIFMECAEAKSSTIVLRGGAEQFIEEAHRSVHDALMVVKRAVASSTVVAGGGAIEMEISRHLRQYARTIEGKAQLLVNAYAKAFEIIPRQIAENAGHDATDILNRLRQKHFKDPEEGKWFGVDITTGGIY